MYSLNIKNNFNNDVVVSSSWVQLMLFDVGCLKFLTVYLFVYLHYTVFMCAG